MISAVTLSRTPAWETATPLLVRLRAAVRPEFAVELIHADPDNPVFARGRCQVHDCERGAWTRLLCGAHYEHWRRAGPGDRETFLATAPPIRGTSDRTDSFDLRGLTPQLRLEIAYSIQRRHDDRTVRLLPTMIIRLVGLVAAAQVSSLLDHSLQRWTVLAPEHGINDIGGRAIGQLRYAWKHLVDLADDTGAEAEFARDRWRATVVVGAGPRSRKPTEIRFDHIDQPWLREATKRACRFRLGAGKAFASVGMDEQGLRWFSRFLTDQRPEVTHAADLTREVLEHYLSWISAEPALGGNTTNTNLVILRGFLQACHRHHWMPGLPARAALYLDELPPRPRPLPRFIPEFVMTQLENDDNLAKLPDDTTRNLLIVIQETGLRANDACALPFNPIITDSVGGPCLKYYNAKMATEQLLPLSPRGTQAIRGQQAHLHQRWPNGCSHLFPAPVANPDGDRCFAYGTLNRRLQHWQRIINLRDETGQPVAVTAHQFRHTLGTRLINSGVPQHVVQKVLGHASPQMTARYATIHDTTVRAAFDDYQQRRVDIHGHRLDFDPGAVTADAEWVKHNLARVQATLPNGYCGRPPQQHCPHPNACLTCPDFQTTPTFLGIHRRQHDDTLELIDLAEQRGNARLAANHRVVAENLQRIITALQDTEVPDAS